MLMKMLKTIVLVIVLVQAACMTMPADNAAPADASVDATVSADTMSTDTGSADTASVDNGSNAQTDASSTAGEVSQTVEVQSPPKCVDKDNDGYCDAAVNAVDCNDLDSSVHPGATEICGNGKDDNCNGQTDEGCTPAPTTTKVTVSYPNSQTRVLNVQVWTSKGQLGGWWDKSVSTTDKSLVANLDVDTTACGLRLNVSEGNPASSWLCEGNGSTANLDTDASIQIEMSGKVYTKSDLKIWSAPGGTSSGCSALLQVVTTGNCAL